MKRQHDTQSLMHYGITHQLMTTCVWGEGQEKESLGVMDLMSFIAVSACFFFCHSPFVTVVPSTNLSFNTFLSCTREREFFSSYFSYIFIYFFCRFIATLIHLFPSICSFLHEEVCWLLLFPFLSSRYKPHRQELPLGRSYLVFFSLNFFFFNDPS